jgi:hypothetical protein
MQICRLIYTRSWTLNELNDSPSNDQYFHAVRSGTNNARAKEPRDTNQHQRLTAPDVAKFRPDGSCSRVRNQVRAADPIGFGFSVCSVLHVGRPRSSSLCNADKCLSELLLISVSANRESHSNRSLDAAEETKTRS